MPSSDPRSAIFISARYALEPGGGGVQRCTREYVATAEAAGFRLEHAVYDFDRRLAARIRRRLFPRPYRNLIPPEFVAATADRIRRSNAGWVFFNQIEAAQLAPALEHLRRNGIRFALLSHGTDSSDRLHTVRVDQRLTGADAVSAGEARWLGRQLFTEWEQHRCFDVVFCLSETDRMFAQWLGASAIHVLPRIVEAAPLDWAPIAGRIGAVGTLVHAPNREGLVRFAGALVRSEAPVRLRLIGRPESVGRDLARDFPCIDYLGGLDDDAYETEARTWPVFANPIFCHARGCSTKLAVALAWLLPVASTRAGARGYFWDEALVPLVDGPDELASLAVRLSAIPAATAQRTSVAALVARSPRLKDVAAQFAAAITRPA